MVALVAALVQPYELMTEKIQLLGFLPCSSCFLVLVVPFFDPILSTLLSATGIATER